MYMWLPLAALALVSRFSLPVVAYTWPDPAYEVLHEFLWKDLNHFLKSPGLCNPLREDGTSPSIHAQWLRTAYHDMATFNNGSGGLDGSLVYGLDRAENAGLSLKVTLQAVFSQQFGKLYLPDVIAAGAVVAVQQCGGPTLPFKAGLIMASGPGPSGVPIPTDTLAQNIASFQQQGFNQTEMIGLVACGHTLGGVTNVDFQNVFSGGNTTIPISPFDGSRYFDPQIATNFVNGPIIDPLANGPAISDSDARIFSSDGNVTIKSFATSADTFMSICASLLERMINTVPSAVILSDPILPIPFTARDYLLSINQDGTLNLQVAADVLSPALNDNRISFQTQDTSLRNGFTLQSYMFSVNVNATDSFSSFWFTVDETGNGANVTMQNNGGLNYPVDDLIVNVPAYTCGILFGTEPYVARITTAVRIDPSAPAPINVTVEASFQNRTTFIPTLSTVEASLSTSPLISPIPELYV
ncbi:heme peroxidase [Mycena sanguinolenta]|nr:heme peroxidase [Mycena sanguinolenta]